VGVARFIADRRAEYRVPHVVACRLLEVGVSWFYKWITRAGDPDGLHTDTDRRRAELDVAVAGAFEAAGGLHGSPRLVADLRDPGWVVSEKTVADSMRRQGLVARRIRRRNGLTKQDKTAPKFPDLVKRDFTATAANRKWVGDITEIPAESGQKLYLATVIDLYSRRLLGAAMGLHPDAELACAAIKMAVAVRGGREAIWREAESERVIFHTDRGSTGGFNWSSQHLDRGGVEWRSTRTRSLVVLGGSSGRPIVRCGRRCARRAGRSRRVRCSDSSGG
jgi:putative transposase